MSINENRRVLQLREQLLADTGNYFLVQNPTPGTGFAEGIVTAYTATTAFISIYNSATATATVPASTTVPVGRRIYLDYIRLICSAAGSTTTSGHAVFTIDKGNRYSSGQTSQPTPWNMLLDTQAPVATSVATINIGPLTATAASSSVILAGRSVLRVAAAPAWILFDEVVFHFGSLEAGQPGAVTAATASKIDILMPPAIVAPGCTFLYQPYNVANATTAPSFEYEIGWFEY